MRHNGAVYPDGGIIASRISIRAPKCELAHASHPKHVLLRKCFITIGSFYGGEPILGTDMKQRWSAKEVPNCEWSNADLLFLSDTLRRGMRVDRVAGFLNRSEPEVRAKARELNVPVADARERRKSA